MKWIAQEIKEHSLLGLNLGWDSLNWGQRDGFGYFLAFVGAIAENGAGEGVTRQRLSLGVPRCCIRGECWVQNGLIFVQLR